MSGDYKGQEEIDKEYHITVEGRGDAVAIKSKAGESLLEAMNRQGVYLSGACGGRGTCGKCRLILTAGDLEITPSDRRCFTQTELEQGYRLACKAIPRTDCTVRLLVGDEADFDITAITKASGVTEQKDGRFAIAIDIGTTTLAVCLLETQSKSILHTYSAVNRQRAYGADVISRIEASNNGKREELRDCIRKDLLLGIRTVIENTGIDKERVEQLAIAGNTTMGHLLLGYSCETLGIYPFTPVNIESTKLSFTEVFASDYLDTQVIILPGISVFVGADIAAGLFECDYDRESKVNLLIDLGTNGEMAIGNKDRILVSSVAAGPAFEGGNLSCGTGSVAGAICSVTLGESEDIRTIGDKPPVGICGTGAIELAYELVKEKIADETGLLCEEYFEKGYPLAKDLSGGDIVLTQRDIREIQLAKAAVRTGIEILMKRYGVDVGDIDTVYLAGGFGYKMNIDKAVGIGLLPKELSGKVKAIGNSSLLGVCKYLTQDGSEERVKNIVGVSEEITLSNDEDFYGLYIGNMNFG